MPPAPDDFTKEERAEYDRVVEMGKGILQRSDARIVESWAKLSVGERKMVAKLDWENPVVTSERGVGYMDPQFSAWSCVHNKLTAMAAKLGFNPTDRGRIPSPPAEDDNPILNEIKAEQEEIKRKQAAWKKKRARNG